MSNKTSFLGLSLLDTSSENSTHFKDWSRNINLEGDADHKSDFQKIDEFAQKITKDLEERPAGVSSWNDLTDKPFGEEGRAPITWDGNTEGRIIIGEEGAELRLIKISDEVVTIEDCVNGCSFISSEGNVYEVPAEVINQQGPIVMFYLLGASVSEPMEQDGIVYEVGTYVAMNNKGTDEYWASITFPGGGIKTLDEKFIPDTIARKADVVVEWGKF